MQTFIVVMREIPGKDRAECVLSKPGPARTKVLNTSEEFALVQEYAKSIGCEALFYADRCTSAYDVECIVGTYRSGRSDGDGRLASTFKRWPIVRRK